MLKRVADHHWSRFSIPLLFDWNKISPAHNFFLKKEFIKGWIFKISVILHNIYLVPPVIGTSKSICMKWFRTFTLFVLTFAGIGAASAQDIHFSQFNMSPLTLNPALTGVIGCEMRMAVNYRNQWASVLRSKAFTTYAASFDMRLPVGRNDYFGIGGSLWSDKVGSASFSTFQGNLMGSYMKRLGGYRSNESYLVVGAQIGVTQRDINTAALIYGDQWNGEDGHTDANGIPLPTQEDLFQPNFLYADMGAGLLYFTALNKQKTSNLYVGLAFHHLNRANMSFTRRNFEALYSKFTVHIGGEFMLSEKLGIVPNILLLKQGPSFETNVGTALKFRLSKTKNNYQAFSVGGAIRLAGHYDSPIASDAAIVNARFDFMDFSLGVSYDLNISALKPATNGNGAFELALQYKICRDKRRKMSCPDF